MEANNTEPIRSVVRCRPLLSKEIQDKRSSIVHTDPLLAEISITNPNGSENEKLKTFSFDHVLGPEISQEILYNEIGFPLVDAVLRGYNGTIFAYGQTGAGKTHTMQGEMESEEFKGIIPRAIEQIFNYIKSIPEKQFLIKISFLKIYNEKVYDLFAADHKNSLQVREKLNVGIYVENLLSLPVESVADAVQKFQLGNQNKNTRSTQMSEPSSRSHTIFSITVESSELLPHGKYNIKKGKLNLVDLAGSERQTRVADIALREAARMSSRLSAFGNVISALSEPRTRHVPYRDSQLTRLLQESLGGNAKTVMIANIGPADWNYDETISTLRFVHRAKSVMNKPIVNEEFREKKEEIDKPAEEVVMEQDKEKSENKTF